MNEFCCKDIYLREGRRVLSVDILPQKCCNFDCIFCPLGRSRQKTDAPQAFGDISGALAQLGRRIDETDPDLVFLNSKGEALVHENLGEVIRFIKDKGRRIKLQSNGYLLGDLRCRELANQCDEVIGELKVITEEGFQKVQRPAPGYTLEKYIANMESFRKQYGGRFILEVTILQGYNDSDGAVRQMTKAVRRLAPDTLKVSRMEGEKFQKRLGISEERLRQITAALESALPCRV